MAEETVRLSNHRAAIHLHKGGLHRALHVPEGTKIPEEKMEQARKSNNPHLKKMVSLADTMASWTKK